MTIAFWLEVQFAALLFSLSTMPCQQQAPEEESIQPSCQPLAAKLAEARKAGIALRVAVPGAGPCQQQAPEEERVQPSRQPLAAKLAEARKAGIALRVAVPGADSETVAGETMAADMVAGDMALEEKPR